MSHVITRADLQQQWDALLATGAYKRVVVDWDKGEATIVIDIDVMLQQANAYKDRINELFPDMPDK